MKTYCTNLWLVNKNNKHNNNDSISKSPKIKLQSH